MTASHQQLSRWRRRVRAPGLQGWGRRVGAPGLQGWGRRVRAPGLQGWGRRVRAPGLQGWGRRVRAPGLQAGGFAGGVGRVPSPGGDRAIMRIAGYSHEYHNLGAQLTFSWSADILVRRRACGLPITQTRTRMSALQPPVPTTLEECEMRTQPWDNRRLPRLVHRDINPVAYLEPPRRNADLPSNAARICFRARPAEPGQAVHPRSVKYKRARKQPNSYQSCGTTERPMVRAIFNPNGVASPLHHRATTPLGLVATPRFSQGSSRLATLGFEPESLWDSALEFPKGRGSNPGGIGLQVCVTSQQLRPGALS